MNYLFRNIVSVVIFFLIRITLVCIFSLQKSFTGFSIHFLLNSDCFTMHNAHSFGDDMGLAVKLLSEPNGYKLVVPKECKVSLIDDNLIEVLGPPRPNIDVGTNQFGRRVFVDVPKLLSQHGIRTVVADDKAIYNFLLLSTTTIPNKFEDDDEYNSGDQLDWYTHY